MTLPLPAAMHVPTLADEAERIGFLLLPGCSLMALGSALDALSLANQCAGKPLYWTVLASVDGQPVTCGGASVAVSCAMDALPRLDALFVVSDTPLPDEGFDAAVHFVREAARRTRLVGAIGTGAWLLARAGLLAGHRATMPPAFAPLLQERFEDTVVSSRPFEVDRSRATCTGGHAAFDLIVHLVGRQHGPSLSLRLAARHAAPPPGRPHRPGPTRPKLAEALELMRANIAEPLATEDIAQLVGVSRRQLERLFKQGVGELPARYYTALRLERARELLQQTALPVLEVARNCGFCSGAHFSSAYRARFGLTPRDERGSRALLRARGVDDTPQPAACADATLSFAFATFAGEPASRGEAACLT